MDKLEEVFKLSSEIRYVAFYQDGVLKSRTLGNVQAASDDESDKYEELIVNPTLLKLTKQRGEIDCGGLDYVIVGYGNFNQLVIPYKEGHLSVAINKEANPVKLYQTIDQLLEEWKRLSTV